MKACALLIVGVVVAWAAHNVDWNREAIGQEVPSDTGFALIGEPVPAANARSNRRAPADLIIGRWRDHAQPDDAAMELLPDGTGTISNDSSTEKFSVLISWTIVATYENACLVNLKYEQPREDGAKPLPPEAKPFKMLAVFDGPDRFVFQRGPSDITVMDRQLSEKPRKGEPPPPSDPSAN